MPYRSRRLPDQAPLDRLTVIGLVILAAVLRFIDLATRGTWDADQGNDMLVLRGLVLDGQLPLLGPPTSIGDFHHGVLYYYVLAPAAALSGADPIGVVAAIALSGVAAVAVTWWLARSIGGPLAGAAAGVLMAVSASAVDESTFIWNPNLIALSSSVALAAAWRAWTSRRARWWVVAAVGTIVTMHCHVLGTALLPVVAGLLVAAIRRTPPGPERARLTRAAGAGAGLLVLSYVPLAIHELTTDFSEARAAIDFVAGGGESSATSLPARFLIVTLRVLAWPLTGLVTAAPAAALLSAGLVIGIAVWRLRAAGGPERVAVRWLAAGLAWSVVALTIGASGLATVIPGLPNDHYHAFADPMVFVIVGLGIAALARWRPAGRNGAILAGGDGAGASGERPIGAIAAVAILVALVLQNLANQPPAIAPDRGWPAARAAAARVLEAGAGRTIRLDSLPAFKPAHAIRFPLVVLGADVAPVGGTGTGEPVARVILCDGLFETAVRAGCGGPAEDALVGGSGVRLVDRFEAAPGRWVSVYLDP